MFRVFSRTLKNRQKFNKAVKRKGYKNAIKIINDENSRVKLEEKISFVLRQISSRNFEASSINTEDSGLMVESRSRLSRNWGAPQV